MTDNNNNTLLDIQGLKMYFPITQGIIIQRHIGDIKAVDGISFFINRGETMGLVGESGCGKSTTGRAILQLYRPTAGRVFFDKEDLTTLKGEALRRKRRQMQMIFQDPYASLNPRMTVADIVGEPLDIHGLASGGERTERIAGLLQMVGLNPEHAGRFPHEFSGGQRQRVGIARALAVNPAFIICDEPISALDVSIQAQVVNLLERLQQELALTYMFIAHDLAMVKHISNRVAVMYVGKIMEIAESGELYSRPQHPYTQALLSAIPIPDPVTETTRERICLTGDVPSPVNPPSGCRFRTRCRYAKPLCAEQEPVLLDAGGGHLVACHLVGG